MSTESRFKKRFYTSAIALGLALGSVGVAAAATGTTAAPVVPTEEVELQEPAYTGSMQAPADDESATEADEASQLEGLTTITAEEAAAAATAAVPGNVVKVALDNENGSVVYSVEITDATGGGTDVKADAGNGTVLDQQADDGGMDETGEANDADDDNTQHENEHEGENDADGGHED